MPRKRPQPLSLLQWYRFGLGIVALILGIVVLWRALIEGGSLPLILMSLVLLGFGILRIRAGWGLLSLPRGRIRRVP